MQHTSLLCIDCKNLTKDEIYCTSSRNAMSLVNGTTYEYAFIARKKHGTCGLSAKGFELKKSYFSSFLSLFSKKTNYAKIH